MTQVKLTVVAALGAVVLMSGCAKRTRPVAIEPPAAAAVPPSPPPPPPAAEVSPAPAATLTEEEAFARKTLEELNAERPLGDVFFDYDQQFIRADARPILQQNAQWLMRWPSTRIRIEGHCDERGTAEYNLALGDRRAAAVRAYLADLGVSADRVVVVSKGKESPVCSDGHEGCWQQNRRGAFTITAK